MTPDEVIAEVAEIINRYLEGHGTADETLALIVAAVTPPARVAELEAALRRIADWDDGLDDWPSRTARAALVDDDQPEDA